MKLKSFLLFIILTLISNAGCISPKAEESWEGISDNTLKITISEFFPFEDNATDEFVKKQINEKLNQRASLILASHITINLTRNKISKDVDVAINKLINDTINNGKMVQYECNENNYCSAHGEYNTTELQKNLELINNQ